MSSVRMSRRLVTAYADAEPWKISHRRAMLCRDIEDCMAWGIRLLSGLVEDENALQAMARAEVSMDDLGPALAELDGSRRELVAVCLRVLETAETLRREGDAIDGVEEFRAAIDEARHMLEAAEFEGELPTFEEMAPLLRPDNPRPERYGV